MQQIDNAFARRSQRAARQRPFRMGPNQSAHMRQPGRQETQMTICTSSSIRTLTVGSGLSPDLLTLQLKPQRRRSRARRLALHGAPPAYRRWGISPRPEDVL